MKNDNQMFALTFIVKCLGLTLLISGYTNDLKWFFAIGIALLFIEMAISRRRIEAYLFETNVEHAISLSIHVVSSSIMHGFKPSIAPFAIAAIILLMLLPFTVVCFLSSTQHED